MVSRTGGHRDASWRTHCRDARLPAPAVTPAQVGREVWILAHSIDSTQAASARAGRQPGQVSWRPGHGSGSGTGEVAYLTLQRHLCWAGSKSARQRASGPLRLSREETRSRRSSRCMRSLREEGSPEPRRGHLPGRGARVSASRSPGWPRRRTEELLCCVGDPVTVGARERCPVARRAARRTARDSTICHNDLDSRTSGRL